MDVLKFISEVWKTNPIKAEDQAQKLLGHIQSLTASFSSVSKVENIEKSDFTGLQCKELNSAFLKSADKIFGALDLHPSFHKPLHYNFFWLMGNFTIVRNQLIMHCFH